MSERLFISGMAAVQTIQIVYAIKTNTEKLSLEHSGG